MTPNSMLDIGASIDEAHVHVDAMFDAVIAEARVNPQIPAPVLQFFISDQEARRIQAHATIRQRFVEARGIAEKSNHVIDGGALQ